MITDILESLGLFMGERKNAMQEARFFLKANRWIMRESGGSWSQPDTINRLLDDVKVRTAVADYLRFLLNTPRVIQYLGWTRYLKTRTPFRLQSPWGWKDPQTTYTLPLWLDLFPQARVVHIYRNGVDVANSLWVRSQKSQEGLGTWRHSRWRYQLLDGTHPHSESGYLSLQDSFDLWENYTTMADQQIAGLPSAQTHVICYESFLQNPLPVLEDLCAFADVSADRAQIEAAASKVNPARANAYRDKPDLRAFYGQVKTTAQMIKYGYGDLTDSAQ